MSITWQDLFEPMDDERDGERAHHIRPHCARCGRWVAEKSVRRVEHRDSLGLADDDYTGTCSVHGERVDVVWDEG